MKNQIALFLLTSIFISCSNDVARKSETSEFLGKWSLSEVLIDPGDGSGTYQPVDSFASLEFLPNGTIASNYSLCQSYTGTATNFSTPYNADGNSILIRNCFPENYTINYAISGENLILYYPCIEACSYKFERIIEN